MNFCIQNKFKNNSVKPSQPDYMLHIGVPHPQA